LPHNVSSTTSQTRVPGTKVARIRIKSKRQTSSQFQAAWLNSRKAAAWLRCSLWPVVSQTRLMVRRPKQTIQAATITQNS